VPHLVDTGVIQHKEKQSQSSSGPWVQLFLVGLLHLFWFILLFSDLNLVCLQTISSHLYCGYIIEHHVRFCVLKTIL
jgi:hypothetical protein